MQPYRLKVLLVENKRVDGKVKQETIGQLGSIEGVWLAGFWQAHDPKLRADAWELHALRARAAFWKQCNARLASLENRIGPDLKKIRMAVHSRVPWPMEAERKRLDLLEAEHGLKFAESMFEHTRKIVASNEQLIERAKKRLAEHGLDSIREAKAVAEARKRVEAIKKT